MISMNQCNGILTNSMKVIYSQCHRKNIMIVMMTTCDDDNMDLEGMLRNQILSNEGHQMILMKMI
jgi:hypothetical protein